MEKGGQSRNKIGLKLTPYPATSGSIKTVSIDPSSQLIFFPIHVVHDIMIENRTLLKVE
jgi:hypothetical protein